MSKQKFYDKPLFGVMCFVLFGVLVMVLVFFPELYKPTNSTGIGIMQFPMAVINYFGIRPVALFVSLCCFAAAIGCGISDSGKTIETTQKRV